MVTWILLAIVGLGFFLEATGLEEDLWDKLPWSAYQVLKKAEAKRRDDAEWDLIFADLKKLSTLGHKKDDEVLW